MPSNNCVVVSYYDERDSAELIRLLRQLRDVDAGAEFTLRVVVNTVTHRSLVLPDDLRDTNVVMRENSGFNIGAWDYGWRTNPGFDVYVFLQDECEIARPGWLRRYVELLSRKKVGMIGESLLYWWSWDQFRAKGPDIFEACLSLSKKRAFSMGRSPTHVQTLALAARGECLQATDGFLVSDSKANAIATEVLFSRLCMDRGYKILQTAWRPFEYIRHPQWDFIREDSRRIGWNLSRLTKNLLLS